MDAALRLLDTTRRVQGERDALEPLRRRFETLKNASSNGRATRTGYQEKGRGTRQRSSLQRAKREERTRPWILEGGFERRLASEERRRELTGGRADDQERGGTRSWSPGIPDRSREQQGEKVPRDELESSRLSLEERRKGELREVKALTERREHDLKKTHASRLAEVQESADKRVASIQAQREADIRALRARHAEETAALRSEAEGRLAAEVRGRKAETGRSTRSVGRPRSTRVPSDAPTRPA